MISLISCATARSRRIEEFLRDEPAARDLNRPPLILLRRGFRPGLPLLRGDLVSEQNCKVCVSGTSTTRSDQEARVAAAHPCAGSSFWRQAQLSRPRSRPFTAVNWRAVQVPGREFKVHSIDAVSQRRSIYRLSATLKRWAARDARASRRPCGSSAVGGQRIFNILVTFAEFEVGLLRMRTGEGMAIARANGKLKGEQPKLSATTARSPEPRPRTPSADRSAASAIAGRAASRLCSGLGSWPRPKRDHLRAPRPPDLA